MRKILTGTDFVPIFYALIQYQILQNAPSKTKEIWIKV